MVRRPVDPNPYRLLWIESPPGGQRLVTVIVLPLNNRLDAQFGADNDL
jgi:hypothetical protein